MTLETRVGEFMDPLTGAAVFKNAKVAQQGDTLSLQVGFACEREAQRLGSALLATLKDMTPAVNRVHITQKIGKHQVQAGLKPLPGVSNIIAIASGKGGVGKSTVSANLAIALKQQGASVGLLDADIYGPSQAKMLGGAERPQSPDGQSMNPIIRHGLQTLSMGDLIEEDTAMIWRGPMVTQTLIQLLNECRWQALDYLIIDLPPGTGDTQLTLAQQIPVTGAVIVTTPQDIALLDVKKAKAMFDKVSIPSLGLVENMSIYRCPNCGTEAAIFGHGGGARFAQQHQIPLLGELPLDIRFRELGDYGVPVTEMEPDSDLAETYRQIAFRLSVGLASQRKSYTQAFPKIVVE